MTKKSKFIRILIFFLLVNVIPFTLYGQDKPPAKPSTPAAPDVLVFANGEQLIGHLVKSVGSSLVFKSDSVGEVTIDWAKVKELHSSGEYAVIPKGVRLRHKEDAASVPQGNLAVSDGKIQVSPPAGPQPSTGTTQTTAQTIPVPNAAYVIEEPTFRKNILINPGLFQDWTAAVTAGAALVQATQNSRSFTGDVSLVRTVPGESWIDLRNRTIVGFSASYGEVTQPNTPTVKTNIIHGGIERDEYLSPKLYAFGSGAWDHNYSQGLDLQQTYGAGLGWTLIKDDVQQLDVKVSADYIRQQFVDSSNNKNLIGSTFGEAYTRKFPHSILLAESFTFIPAWNDFNAYSGIGNVTLGLPLYKRFNLTLGTIDTFLNNPPTGFKKNSFQFISGLTYTFP